MGRDLVLTKLSRCSIPCHRADSRHAAAEAMPTSSASPHCGPRSGSEGLHV